MSRSSRLHGKEARGPTRDRRGLEPRAVRLTRRAGGGRLTGERGGRRSWRREVGCSLELWPERQTKRRPGSERNGPDRRWGPLAPDAVSGSDAEVRSTAAEPPA